MTYVDNARALLQNHESIGREVFKPFLSATWPMHYQQVYGYSLPQAEMGSQVIVREIAGTTPDFGALRELAAADLNSSPYAVSVAFSAYSLDH